MVLCFALSRLGLPVPYLGHNLESTWLLDDTLDYLLSIKAISAAKADGYRATVMSIGAAAVRDGFDPEHGGIYESGSPTGGPSSKVKVWWVQVRAVRSHLVMLQAAYNS